VIYTYRHYNYTSLVRPNLIIITELGVVELSITPSRKYLTFMGFNRVISLLPTSVWFNRPMAWAVVKFGLHPEIAISGATKKFIPSSFMLTSDAQLVAFASDTASLFKMSAWAHYRAAREVPLISDSFAK
jgi:hypothetical protein